MNYLPASEESLSVLSPEEITNLQRFKSIYLADTENQEIETYRHFTAYANAVKAGFYTDD